jgi:protein-disulfide isomerase
MLLSRRSVLALAGALAASPALAQDASPTGQRAIGNPKAPVQVMEFFSLTCTHCAAFARETYPQVKQQLIDTGKLFYIFRDFPLDQVALLGEMVARSLPPDRYEPFLLAMFQTQDRWAFARGINSTDEIGKMAALAGMPRATFEKVVQDDQLKQWILTEQDQAQKQYGVNSTPTFVVNGSKAKDQVHAGEMSFDAFQQMIQQATG